ncbi:hypothetical protein IBTHAUMO2_620009 [Nitrosopumilaceae archaeon]|nr:hypothetical protein IBTHAUMO2_620009 [Nitrosopumilaceae archaeon]
MARGRRVRDLPVACAIRDAPARGRRGADTDRHDVHIPQLWPVQGGHDHRADGGARALGEAAGLLVGGIREDHAGDPDLSGREKIRGTGEPRGKRSEMLEEYRRSKYGCPGRALTDWHAAP